MFSQKTKASTHKIVSLENKINIWIESFGDPKDEPIVLISGAGAQCVLWPSAFCQKLVEQGYFVIRYDNRDTGKSSAVNYTESPYTILDLAKDAVEVLKSFSLKSAHIVGFSMGGQIAQFIGAYYATYAKSLTLIGTSTSFKEGFDAFSGKEIIEGLSPPRSHYIKWATRPVNVDQQSLAEKVEDFVTSWKFLSGDKAPFDEKLYKEIGIDCYERSELTNPYPNHALAMQASYEEHRKAPALIKVPTLIIHGTEDPVFPIDHAESLHKAIKGSNLAIVNDMGHNVGAIFFDEIIKLIRSHVSQAAHEEKNHFESLNKKGSRL